MGPTSNPRGIPIMKRRDVYSAILEKKQSIVRPPDEKMGRFTFLKVVLLVGRLFLEVYNLFKFRDK